MCSRPIRVASARILLLCAAALIVVIALQGPAAAAKSRQTSFDSPEAAVEAFIGALVNHSSHRATRRTTGSAGRNSFGYTVKSTVWKQPAIER